MKNFDELAFATQMKEVKEVVQKYARIRDREIELIDKGYEITEQYMGSGGVLNVRVINRVIYMQIGYGHGRYNKAKVVILKRDVFPEKNKR